MTAIVLDTETTGFSHIDDRITEIAIVEYESELLLLHSFVNPLRDIPPKITEITGISGETVASAPTFHDISKQVADIIMKADAVIAHNPWFDQRMITAELKRSNLEVIWPTLICTKRIWDIYEPRTERHLTNAYKRFVDNRGFDGAHGALADTNATLAVLRSQIATFEELQNKEWSQFDPEQKTWYGPSNHVVWSGGVLLCNFGKYKGIPVHEIDAGYWRWLSDQDFPEHVKELGDYIQLVAIDISAERIATWAYGRY